MYNQSNNGKYEQFTYGKLDQFSPDKVIAVSPGLKGQQESLRDIAEQYTFWQPPLGTTEKKAVGIFLIGKNLFGDDDKFIVLAKAAIVRSNYSGSYVQYHYVFIPSKDVEKANQPNAIYELLLWFAPHSIPQTTKNLEKLYIPVLDAQRANEYGDNLDEQIQDIQSLLEEKDSNDEPYLLMAVSSLLSDQSVLINLTPSNLVDPLIFLRTIIRLLPTACRYELSVAIGDFDEDTTGNWARLLVKLVESDSINDKILPQGCVWLNRSKGSVLGASQLYNPNCQRFFYADKIKEILTQPDTDWILSLLQELNSLADSSWNFAGLKALPSQAEIHSHEIKLGLWGVPGAGKTTYILQLYQCMSDDSSGFNIFAPDTISQDFIRNKLSELATNRYISPTEPGAKGDGETITYTIETLYTLMPQSITMSFIDAAGGHYLNLGIYTATEDVMDIKVNGDKSLVQDLTDCDGIIFLLAPDIDRTNAESHQLMVPNVLQLLRRYAKEAGQPLGSRGRLQQFMAFCANKVDQAEYWESRNNPKELVKSILGTAVGKLNNHCYYNEEKEKFNQSEHNRCKLFAVSSIGRRKEITKSSEGEEKEQWLELIEYPDSDNANDPNITPSDFFYDEKSETTTNTETDTPNDVEEPKHPSRRLFGGQEEPISTLPGKSPRSIETRVTQPMLKLGVNPEPFNVIDPVKWLIRKIYAHQMK